MGSYEDLALAVVKQAAKDWIASVKRLKKKPDDKRALSTKIETERFFRSEWFMLLSDVDGDALLTRLRREYLL